MIQITWLGHATFHIQVESGEALVLDPWIEGNPSYPQGHEIHRADAIALSHGHFDHVNSVIPLAKKFEPKVIAIGEIAGWFESRGVKNAIGMNKGGTVDLGFVKLTMTHAVHSSSIQDGDKTIYGGEPAGYILTFQDGRRAYFAGDTSVFSELKLYAEIYHPELAFLPIGDHYTMGPEEAAYAARMLGAKAVVPMHYGTFPVLTGRPEQLEKHLSGSGIKVLNLQAGHTVQW
ncbi:MAG TPA: metal-dependent hydrolase [Bryobacteraceae bacterium]|nr:metal-dependent hydrolase [Bryobacteraceae bacterium]